MMLLFSLFLACSETQEEPSKEKPKTEVKDDKDSPEEVVDPKKNDAHGDHGGHGMAAMDVGEIPAGAKVFFISPKDGETIKGDVKIQMGVEGMTVKPAGEVVKNTGHHHILIDTDPVKKGAIVPGDDKHKHFGKGQTETTLQLAPGQHTLQLQFANGIHVSYGEQMSAKISITVEAADK